MYDTGTPKPVFCDNVEGWDGVQDAGSRGVQKGGGYMYTYGQFMLIYGKTTTL